MMSAMLKEATATLEALRSIERPRTIDESVAHTILQMSDAELRRLARKAYVRSFGSVLLLVHAEFLRRRSHRLALAA